MLNIKEAVHERLFKRRLAAVRCCVYKERAIRVITTSSKSPVSFSLSGIWTRSFAARISGGRGETSMNVSGTLRRKSNWLPRSKSVTDFWYTPVL